MAGTKRFELQSFVFGRGDDDLLRFKERAGTGKERGDLRDFESGERGYWFQIQCCRPVQFIGPPLGDIHVVTTAMGTQGETVSVLQCVCVPGAATPSTTA